MNLRALSFEFVHPGFNKMIPAIRKDEILPYAERQARQEEALRRLIRHAFTKVPYYVELSRNIGIEPGDIRTIKDLDMIPVLTRDDVKNNIDKFEFYEKGAKRERTGGTTGQPLHYLVSRESYYRGVALLFCHWGRGGYSFGDKLFLFAGASLVGKPTLKSKLVHLARNSYGMPSYGLTPEKLDNASKWIMENKPSFIRGYPSVISYLADYFHQNNYRADFIKAVFSTAEPLLPVQRGIISRAFNTQVFDNYGLHDGGVTAFECEMHRGMHIDTFRSVLQVCDDSGKTVPHGTEGHIIATDLYNYAFPFIRYDTGDSCITDDSQCECGRTSPRIIQITGRSAEALTIGDYYISGTSMCVPMAQTKADMYKIIQKTADTVEIYLLFLNRDDSFINEQIRLIDAFFAENAPIAKLKYNIYKNYQDFPAPENKLKHIVNETLSSSQKH